MELNQTIRKISFLFFVATGMLHFIGGMMYANEYLSGISGSMHRVLYIPFVISALLYGGSIIREEILRKNKSTTTFDYVGMGIMAAVFIGLLAIEFIFPNNS